MIYIILWRLRLTPGMISRKPKLNSLTRNARFQQNGPWARGRPKRAEYRIHFQISNYAPAPGRPPWCRWLKGAVGELGEGQGGRRHATHDYRRQLYVLILLLRSEYSPRNNQTPTAHQPSVLWMPIINLLIALGIDLTLMWTFIIIRKHFECAAQIVWAKLLYVLYLPRS